MMTDEMKQNEEQEKMYPKSEMEEIIKKRLRNQAMQNEELQMQLQQMQQQMQQAAIPQQQAMAPQNNGGMAAQAGTEPPQQNSPMDEATLRRLLEENNTNNMNHMQTMQDYNHYLTSVNKMRNEDDEFNQLADSFKENKKIMPDEVAMHLTKALPYKQAKKAFSKVMANDLDYLKMMNHYQHGMLTQDWTPYQQWVQGLMIEPSTEGKAHTPVPELKESESFSAKPKMDNVDRYLSNF